MAAHQLPHIIQDLSLILVAAAITTLIFRKLKQPLVLGYIIAGLLVGPQIDIIPNVTDRESVETWAEIGVIFLLFSLGLEFSFKKLVKVGGAASITAFTEIIVIVVAGYFTGRLMGWNRVDCIFLGGMLASSSTTIIIRAFDELKVKTQQFAKTVFGVLIVEDIVVILILVLLPTIAISQQFQGKELFFTVLKLLFFLFIWFLAGIFLVPTLLKQARKLINDETLLIIAIGLCFGMVVFATKVGFSAELGAFIMGSIFAETTKAEKIEHVLTPIKDLFGAIFFVSIGMMINLEAMWQYIGPILIITLLTIVGKFLSTTLGALLSGQTLKHSVKVGMSMAQIGEFAFIIATLGLSLGVTSDFLFPVAVGVAVITTFTTPYMIKHSDRMHLVLERILPGRVLNIISNYSSYSQSVNGTSAWKKLTKAYLQILIVNSIIVLAIVILSTQYLLPLALSWFAYSVLAKVVTLVLTILAMLPFIWALAIKKPSVASSYEIMKQNKRFSWAPVVVINILRGLVLFLLFGFLLDRLFSSWISLLCTLAAVMIVLFFFRNKIQHLYGRLESRFLTNLNEREQNQKMSGIASASLATVPWDVHVEEFLISPLSDFLGQTLEALAWREKFGINVALIERGEKTIYAPGRYERIFPGDKLFIIGTDEQLEQIRPVLDAPELTHGGTDDGIAVQKMILTPHHNLVGKTIRESGIREATKGLVIGIERPGGRLLNPASEELLQAGDILWLAGNKKRIKELLKAAG
jgi:CPA2 family monovalent cation:H+ antiporter-2